MVGTKEAAKMDREDRTAPDRQTTLVKKYEIRQTRSFLKIFINYLVPYLVTNLEAMGAERYMTPLYKLPTDETDALLA